MIWPIAKMMLALGVILTFLFLLVRILRRSQGMPGSLSQDSGIRLLTTRPIAPQKYVSLVEIGGEVLALGISEAQITFLAKIENREFVEKMKSRAPAGIEPLSWFHSLSLKARRPGNGLMMRLFYGK
jgi:flagellar biogenesis protein FliO